MATKEDVELIREAERLHTKFVTVFCILTLVGLLHLLVWGIVPAMALIATAQAVLVVIAIRCFQNWRQYREQEQVELVYRRHKEQLDRKAP